MFDPDRRHLIAYLAAAAVLVVIAGRFVGSDNSAATPRISMAAPKRSAKHGARPRAAPAQIWVDVAGAVVSPGLYALPQGARVAAAIERAGGVNARANRAAVNLAAKLVDGQQVFVPRGGSGGAAGSGAAGASGGTGSGATGATGAAASAGGASGSATASAPISLSNATQEQLEQLDGIGPALAQRIIEYRNLHGGFRSTEELQQVSGIGEKRFDALKSSITP